MKLLVIKNACLKTIFALTVSFICAFSLSAQINITGTVNDDSGSSMPGVNVTIKGTTIGSITDVDGKYSMNVPDENTVLVFSFIGFTTQEVVVGNQRIVNVSLNEEIQDIEEVVVVGYMTQRKIDLTGAVGVADVKKMQDTPAPNVLQSLQGQVPGLYVSMDGQPSGESTIRVRGVSTLNNNDPLYIIDGVPTKSSAFRILNPADIESIQVLKDASSAAIYGSRASNGVIIVQTKRAGTDHTEVSYNMMLTHSYYGTKPQLLNTRERALVGWRAAIYDGRDPADLPYVNYQWHRDANGTAILDDISFPEYIVPGVRTADTDWFDAMTRNGFIQQHELSVSAGTKTTGTRVSFRYFDNKYVHEYRNAKRYSLRVNSFQNLFNDVVRIGQNITVVNNVDNGYNGGTALDRALKSMSILPIYKDDGTYSGPPNGEFTDDENPLMVQDIEQDDKRDNVNIFGNVYANIKLAKNLTWNTTFGIDLYHRHERDINRSFLTGIKTRATNEVSNRRSQDYTWTFNSTLQYDLNLNNDHQFVFLGGIEAIRNMYEQNYSRRTDFAIQDEDYFYESAGSGSSHVDGTGSGYSLFSYFGKINYSAFNKYLASATLRYDGTSRVGANNRFGIFPAFSAGWRISEESFIKDNVLWLSTLKLRAGWGKTGNQEIANDAVYTIYQSHVGEAAIAFNSDNGTAYDINGADSGAIPAGYRRASTGNNDLKWESTTEFNIGLDVGIAGTGLTASLDYFKRKTSDILIRPTVLAVQGEGASRYFNGATVENSGFELLIDYRDNIGEVDYGITFNIGHYADKITHLPEDVIGSYAGTLDNNILGRSMNSLFGYVADGLFRSQQEVDAHAIQPGKGLGRIRYKDVDGDGSITALDRDWIGQSTPKYEFGFNLTAQYRKFDFTVFFQGILGMTVNEGFRRYTHFTHMWAGTNWGKRTLDAWSPENPDSNIPAATFINNNNEDRYSTFWLTNGSYLKMRRITLGYTLPDLGVFKQFRIYVSGDNLLTIKDTKGANAFDSPDPENPGNGYARPQNITFGLNLTF